MCLFTNCHTQPCRSYSGLWSDFFNVVISSHNQGTKMCGTNEPPCRFSIFKLYFLYGRSNYWFIIIINSYLLLTFSVFWIYMTISFHLSLMSPFFTTFTNLNVNSVRTFTVFIMMLNIFYKKMYRSLCISLYSWVMLTIWLFLLIYFPPWFFFIIFFLLFLCKGFYSCMKGTFCRNIFLCKFRF